MDKFVKWFKVEALFLVLGIVIVLGYRVNWDTGLKGKTLWDWLNLLAVLAIPVVVGFGTLWFTAQQNKENEAVNNDNQCERVLQEYIDKISDLLLKGHLRESAPALYIDSKLVLRETQIEPEERVRTIARARTLTTLSRLDSKRKKSVLQFLQESGLLKGEKPIIVLDGADLSGADLSGANLSEANLYKVHFRGANLCLSNLYRTYLRGANLDGADLRGANLGEADLGGANLWGANLGAASLWRADLKHTIFFSANLRHTDLEHTNITQEQLKQAKSLKGATMPDGSKHP